MLENEELVLAVLEHIENELDRIMWNIYQEEYASPFRNTGNRFEELDCFKVRAYNWAYRDESIEEEPNFEWRDYKLWWYKYCGGGLYANREISNDELNIMLKECMRALREYERGKEDMI